MDLTLWAHTTRNLDAPTKDLEIRGSEGHNRSEHLSQALDCCILLTNHVSTDCVHMEANARNHFDM